MIPPVQFGITVGEAKKAAQRHATVRYVDLNDGAEQSPKEYELWSAPEEWPIPQDFKETYLLKQFAKLQKHFEDLKPDRGLRLMSINLHDATNPKRFSENHIIPTTRMVLALGQGDDNDDIPQLELIG